MTIAIQFFNSQDGIPLVLLTPMWLPCLRLIKNVRIARPQQSEIEPVGLLSGVFTEGSKRGMTLSHMVELLS